MPRSQLQDRELADYRRHPHHREMVGLTVLALVALVIQTGFVLVALFGPNLPYLVSNARSMTLDSDDFLRTIAAVTGSQASLSPAARVLANGERFYAAELDAIRSARRSISLEAYIFHNGEIGRQYVEALAAAARSGVAVRLVIDAIGSASLHDDHLKPLTDAGARYAWYHPLRWYTWPRINNRTHRELLIVDGRAAFVGGAGVADQWHKPNGEQPPWRDTMVRVEGPAVTALQGIFAENWLEASGEVLTGDASFPETGSAGKVPTLVVGSSPTEGRSTPARVLFQTLLASARKSIRISTPYFLPDHSMRDELTHAIHRGVKVEIIVPGAANDHLLTRTSSRRLYGDILRAGGRIWEYQPTMIHTKLLIVDSLWSVVGSTNMDPRSFSLNDEVNTAFRDPELAARLEADFAADLARSRPATLEQWQRRPLWERATEFVGSLIERQQ